MSTKLSDFLSDMRDAPDKTVAVTEEQLRGYTISMKHAEAKLQNKDKLIAQLKHRISVLETSIEVMKIQHSTEVIDLYA